MNCFKTDPLALFTLTDLTHQNKTRFIYESDIDIDLRHFLESCDEGIRTPNSYKKTFFSFFAFSDLV